MEYFPSGHGLHAFVLVSWYNPYLHVLCPSDSKFRFVLCSVVGASARQRKFPFMTKHAVKNDAMNNVGIIFLGGVLLLVILFLLLGATTKNDMIILLGNERDDAKDTAKRKDNYHVR